MVYSINISTPASTTKASPLRTTLLVEKGIVHRVLVAFPPGPQTDLNVAIDRGSSQVWPGGASEAFAWDNLAIDIPEWYPIEEEPLEFVVRTWNVDASFAHLCMVQVYVLPREVLTPASEAVPILRRLSRLIFREG